MLSDHYDVAFYQRQRLGSYHSAAVIIPILLEMFPVGSVCDVGCGLGTWLQSWREHGAEDVLGIDGDYVDAARLMIPQHRFRCHDLQQPLEIERRFDLAMSLEVAEHLPPERAESFVGDLTSLADIVVFSAAIPGQTGTNHLHERWQDYWAELFHKRGYFTFDVLRPRIWQDDRVEYWYRQNILIFCRYDAVSRYPGLVAAATSVKSAIPAVHPQHPMGTWQSLTILKGALRRSAQLRMARWRSPDQAKS
ncbi:MAG TPA: class I SAM-dependent methyltransferase [Rhodopila sp.]|nr:class I SAM-dependent methyltransferase [Rhodopila sp.]